MNIKMWTVNYTVYNLIKTETSEEKGLISIELWLKKKRNISSLRAFGEKVIFYIPKQKRRKWNIKVEKGVFVEYDKNERIPDLAS